SALAADHGLQLCAVESFARAKEELSRFNPDALVVAFEEPHIQGVDQLRSLRAASTVPILVISRPVGEDRVTQLIKAGAGGYLFARDALGWRRAGGAFWRGGVPMPHPVPRLVLGRARRSSATMAAVRPATPQSEGLLTPRQREILKLLANGHSYED